MTGLTRRDFAVLLICLLGTPVLLLSGQQLAGAGGLAVAAGLALGGVAALVWLSYRRTQTALRMLMRFVQGRPAPPRVPPPHLQSGYTLGGQIPIVESYHDDTYAPSQPRVYTVEEVESNLRKIADGTFNYYGQTGVWLHESFGRFDLKGKNVAVFGSISPRCESLLIHRGAQCTVIEYNAIVSRHPEIVAMTPAEYETNPIQFDAAVSISTFEHDGLGRYGDPLDPEGDLKAMAQVRDMLVPGGPLFLSVPIGKDKVVWNAHRIYGRIRFPLLLNGWEMVDSEGYAESGLDRDTGTQASNQPILVLRRKD